MLVLTRKIGESIMIGHNVKVMVVNSEGGQVRLGIEAPPEVVVHREEIYRMIQKENVMASAPKTDEIKKIAQALRDKKGSTQDRENSYVKKVVRK